jgi:lysophospholipase L1-like esterase
MFSSRLIFPRFCVLSLLFCLSVGFTSTAATKWVGSWSTAPQLVETNNNPPSPGLTDNALRQIIKVSLGGDTLRLKFSNEFSTSPVTLESVYIAVSKGGGAIEASTSIDLTFDGQASATMQPGAVVYSDPIAFALTPRMELAITINFGQTSASVTGHPGSRTTSYLLTGYSTPSSDFSTAVRTEHWYVINALEVRAPEEAYAVAILGNSITDGRGSVTDQQNRWTDIFSERLLKQPETSQVGVLNMGIGGNCVLGNCLGPSGVSRFERDILNQAGVKWAVIFEGVNDLGYASNGAQTANNLIAAYKQLINAAHAKGIFVYGATIMPFKGNGYYTADHEVGRGLVNEWIRHGGAFDGVIDFDKAMRNPADTLSLATDLQADYLHPNAAGHRAMGNYVDLTLFSGTDTLVWVDPRAGSESIWMEAERRITTTQGKNFQQVSDATASNGVYLKTVNNVTAAAPADSAGTVYFRFTANKDTTYHVYARLNCPSYDDDSYWTKLDNGAFSMANGLVTSGWQWKLLGSYNLTAGSHVFVMANREDGACLDKLCVSSYEGIPTGMGGDDPLLTGLLPIQRVNGFKLAGLTPNPAFGRAELALEVPLATSLAMALYKLDGTLAHQWPNQNVTAGQQRVSLDVSTLPSGYYVCRVSAGPFRDQCALLITQ